MPAHCYRRGFSSPHRQNFMFCLSGPSEGLSFSSSDRSRPSTEVGLQVARQWCYRNRNSPSKVFLKLDFSNAFNTINRENLLSEVRQHMPGMAAWVDFCYARPSKLVFGARTMPPKAVFSKENL